MQNAAMAQAMNEIATITSAAVNQCVQRMPLRIPHLRACCWRARGAVCTTRG